MKLSKLHALASACATYLLDQAGEHIKEIYLFGSVARGEATQDSDIDLFIDSVKNKQTIQKATQAFESTTAAKTYRAIGIKNTIRALLGDLSSNEFSDLRLNIAADGIILYGKTISGEKNRRVPHLLIWFETPKQQKKKVAFLRQIYGRVEKGKIYSGLLQQLQGIKAGPNTLLVPIRHKATLLAALKKSKVNYTIRNVWI